MQYLTKQELEFFLQQQVELSQIQRSPEDLQQELESLRQRISELEEKSGQLSSDPEISLQAIEAADPNWNTQAFLDSIQSQIWYFIDPYTYGLVNQAHADFLGLSKQDLYQANIINVLKPSQAERCIKENLQVFQRKKQLTASHWICNSQGEERLLEITRSPILNQEGKTTSLVCNAQDVTKYKVHQTALMDKLRKLRSRILIDDLTQIPNRRHLDEFLRREWGRAKRERSSISLLMVDIDYFKSFNDSYGHLAGDHCLQQVSKTLAQTVSRPTDLVARYGGEEFAVVLPKTDLQGAYQVAEKIRSNIQSLGIAHTKSPVAGVVTVSIGSATSLPLAVLKDISQETLLNNSDQALYEAKQAGRNQVVCRELQFNLKS